MAHRDLHPSYVEGCFGCKVKSLGYDGGHLTKSTKDELNNTTTQHRDGRVDVVVRPETVVLETRQ